jgi:hypothetical protein
MGIEKKTITIVTCDMCHRECGERDGEIRIRVNGGDRDVGPATIDGEIRFTQPYGVSGGIVCKSCKLNWLKHYVDQLCREFEQSPTADPFADKQPPKEGEGNE